MKYSGYIILALIIAYCVFVIIRRIRKARKGEFCDCGCDGCAYSESCKDKKK